MQLDTSERVSSIKQALAANSDEKAKGAVRIASEKQIELFAWSNTLVKSRNLWERRLSLVLLTHFVKDRNSRTQIEKTLARLSGDKEHYVKKAVAWLQRDLRK